MKANKENRMICKSAFVALAMLLPTPVLAGSPFYDLKGREFHDFSQIHHRRAVRSGNIEVVRHSRDQSSHKPSAGLREAVTRSALDHGIPAALARAIVAQESGFRCDAPHGGLTQILPGTQRSVGVRGSSCAQNLEAGMRYLAIAYQAAGGDWCGTATRYNRGTGSGGCSGYGRSVLRRSSMS